MADIITKQRVFRKQLNLSVLYSVCEKYRLKLHTVRFSYGLFGLSGALILPAPRTAV